MIGVKEPAAPPAAVSESWKERPSEVVTRGLSFVEPLWDEDLGARFLKRILGTIGEGDAAAAAAAVGVEAGADVPEATVLAVLFCAAERLLVLILSLIMAVLSSF